MNGLNSLIIEGEVTEINKDVSQLTLAYQRTTQNAISIFHFLVNYPVSYGFDERLKVGSKIRLVGRLEQNVITDNVAIIAEHIEIKHRRKERKNLSNE